MHVIITSKGVLVKLVKFCLGTCNISVVLVGDKNQLNTGTMMLVDNVVIDEDLMENETGVMLWILFIVLS